MKQGVKCPPLYFDSTNGSFSLVSGARLDFLGFFEGNTIHECLSNIYRECKNDSNCLEALVCINKNYPEIVL